jgi:hypothetical protein
MVAEFAAKELERVVVELFKGDAFGESGLETETKSTRSASVRALRNCHLVEVVRIRGVYVRNCHLVEVVQSINSTVY